MARRKSSSSVRERREQQLAQQKQRRQMYYGLTAVGVIVIIALFAFLRQVNTPSVDDVVLPDSLEAPPNTDGSAWGPADAPVVIEEFSDFQ